MENKSLDRNSTITLNNGRQIGFKEYGDPNGVPVFYFHGTPGSRLEAARFHEVAVANRVRVIGIDRPGMGLSTFDKNRSLLSWAQDLANVADALGIGKFSIVGHSGGAPFVAACAYAIPERLKGAAIVSGMGPLEKPESRIGMARGQRIVNSLLKNIPGLATLMMKLTFMMLKKPKMMAGMIKQLPEVDQAIFRDPILGKALRDSTLEAFRNGVAGPAFEMKLLFRPWGFDLEKIQFPIMIWQGTLDVQAPLSHAKLYASLIPGAKLKIIENEGHLSLIQHQCKNILTEALSPLASHYENRH